MPAFEPIPISGDYEPYQIYGVDDIFNLPEPEWLMENVIPKGGSTLIFGGTNVGKSLLALHWMLKLATAPKYPGVKYGTVPADGLEDPLRGKARVLYIYAEGGHDLQTRVQSWEEGTGFREPEMYHNIDWIGLVEEINLRWDPDQPSTVPVAVERLLATVDRWENNSYDIVVFDPAQQVWSGMDGNSDRDVQMAYRLVRELANRVGAASVIVHHARKEGDTFRGATTWTDLVDVAIAVKEDKNVTDLINVTTVKNRFGRKDYHWRFVRESIMLERHLPGREGVYLREMTKEDAAAMNDSPHNLTPTEEEAWKVLMAKQKLTVAELADALDKSRQQVNALIRALYNKGYALQTEEMRGRAKVWIGKYPESES